MTQIDAINRMLRYIGELPVPTDIVIDDLPEGHEAIQARTILQETLREEQEERFWFNTRTLRLVPDVDGYITVPQNVISIDTSKGKYTVEGNDVYDIELQTKVFDNAIELECLLEIDFDDVPDVFRNYVVLTAAKHLHTYLNGDETTQKELETKIQLQRLKVDREHLRQSKFNLVRGARLLNRTSIPTPLA